MRGLLEKIESLPIELQTHVYSDYLADVGTSGLYHNPPLRSWFKSDPILVANVLHKRHLPTALEKSVMCPMQRHGAAAATVTREVLKLGVEDSRTAVYTAALLGQGGAMKELLKWKRFKDVSTL